MTAVTDAKLIIETILGRTLTNEELTRIGDNFFKAAMSGRAINISAQPIFEYDSLGNGTLIETPTNEQKAQLVLDTIKRMGQTMVRHGAQEAERNAVEASIPAAGNAAEADFT